MLTLPGLRQEISDRRVDLDASQVKVRKLKLLGQIEGELVIRDKTEATQCAPQADTGSSGKVECSLEFIWRDQSALNEKIAEVTLPEVTPRRGFQLAASGDNQIERSPQHLANLFSETIDERICHRDDNRLAGEGNRQCRETPRLFLIEEPRRGHVDRID